jgi:hypothetical protein
MAWVCHAEYDVVPASCSELGAADEAAIPVGPVVAGAL